MAYTISSARKHFDNQVDEIVRRLRIADRRGTDPELRSYAIAAAIFLAHAEVENYFVDALSGIAKIYSGSAYKASRLPGRLRAHLTLSKANARILVANSFAGKDEDDTLVAVERWFTPDGVACFFDDQLNIPLLSGKDIYGTASYPSKKNLEKVLRRVGIGDPKGELNKIAKRDVASILESVASLRTSLAHTATLPGVSCKDAGARVKDLRVFVKALDRLFHKHTVATHSRSSWVAHMH